MLYFLIIFQLGCLFKLLSGFYYYQIFDNLFQLILGFTDAGLTSTLLSYQNDVFARKIYMLDAIYMLYNISMGLGALFFGICNFLPEYVSSVFLDVLGLINIAAIYKLYK